MIEAGGEDRRIMTTAAIEKPLIIHGVRDEVFVMADLGFEIDIATLIYCSNLAPREELDIREGSIVDLMEIVVRQLRRPDGQAWRSANQNRDAK